MTTDKFRQLLTDILNFSENRESPISWRSLSGPKLMEIRGELTEEQVSLIRTFYNKARKQNPVNIRLVGAYFSLIKKPFELWKIDPRNKKRRRRQIQRHSAR
jgi:hypothetical protein